MKYCLLLFMSSCIMISCSAQQNSTQTIESESINMEEKQTQFLCGGYTTQRELTHEDSLFFENVVSNTEYKDLTPQSVATQVVAGINFHFVCSDKNNKKINVIIYKPLPGQGEATITKVEESD